MHVLMESAVALRQILQEKHRELDSKQYDPALARMVVIGHSQGGLLTKTTVVDTGDRLWRSLSDEFLERMNINAEARDMHHRFLFIDSLPSVIRVVFIATPHRGSFLAKNWVASLFLRFASLPAKVVKGASSFLIIAGRAFVFILSWCIQ